MGVEAIDQSGSRIDPVWFVAQGGRVIGVYCGEQSWKVPPASYVRACHRAGAGVFWFWEDGARNALGGAAQGHIDGRKAKQQMDAIVAAVGYRPDTRTSICPAIDFDTNKSQYPAIDAYCAAFKAEVEPAYRFMDYGEAELLDHEAFVGNAQWGVGTYAWSGGIVSVHAAMQQYLNGRTLHGASVDYDRIVNAAQLGAWWPPGHTPAGGGTPLEDDVPYRDWPQADKDALASDLLNKLTGGQPAVTLSLLGDRMHDLMDGVAAELHDVHVTVDVTRSSTAAIQSAYAADRPLIQSTAAKVGALDADALAEALAPKLAAALPSLNIPQSELESALRSVFGSLDNVGGTT